MNVNKTKIVIFRSPTKQIYEKLNFRLSGQEIEPKPKFEPNLGVVIDEYLSSNKYMNTLKERLNKANVTADVLETVYYAFLTLI